MSTETKTPKELLNNGLSLMRQAYYSHVRDLAQDYRQDIIAGDFADREALIDRIDQDVDGDAWVIYTFKAQCVLMCSDNDSAGPDSLGADGFDWSAGIPWSQLAYFALQADLYEQLDAEGIDVNDDGEGWPAVCPGCKADTTRGDICDGKCDECQDDEN